MGDRAQRVKGKAEETKGRVKRETGVASGRSGTEARGAGEDGGLREVGAHAPAELARYIAPKGSVALDGISLTVKRGGTIAQPLSQAPVFPAMVTHMVGVGAVCVVHVLQKAA